ncbi:MAG: FkbM family methyltransferase [Lachnospiraceae bacterium]|nr:FkbM family methyltransferase [Lachnospiraceae bacterium]
MPEQQQIKKIYRAVSDELSRKIFCSRLLYSMTGDIESIKWMMDDFRESAESNEKWMMLKNRIEKLDKKPYIFGKGAYGKILCEKTGGKKVWKGFIDNQPEASECMGLPVIQAEDFLGKYSGEKVVLSSKAFLAEMRSQLLSAGINEENIIDGTAWYDATEGRQYFDLPHLVYSDDEVFVDGGSCDGMSAVRFAEECRGKYEKIFCFEPDKKNIERLKHNFDSRNVENYEVINKGLWNEKQELSFSANGAANSHIVAGNEGSAAKIEVVSLDEALGGTRASFIKLDIEGAEYKALQGAEKTITQYKPKLAVCVYHKPGDIWELPELILEMRPDYKLYFRHYSDRSIETVLYAI